MLRHKALEQVLILCLVATAFAPAMWSQEKTNPTKPDETKSASSQGAAKQAPAGEDSDALRKAAQNPVASLISVPVQENFNFNISPFDRTQNVLNIQPVISARISENWNLITIPQVNEGAGKDDDGTKTKTDGPTATGKEVNTWFGTFGRVVDFCL